MRSHIIDTTTSLRVVGPETAEFGGVERQIWTVVHDSPVTGPTVVAYAGCYGDAVEDMYLYADALAGRDRDRRRFAVLPADADAHPMSGRCGEY